jgi:hypothetical protein
MLNDVLVFLKDRLNLHLRIDQDKKDGQEDQVSFLRGHGVDSPGFKVNAVSLVMINLQQENVLRPPDLYNRSMPNGTFQKVQPEIRLNVYVLFAANYEQYDDGLRVLSAIIQYFQNHRVFGRQDSPQLSENIEQLAVELVTLTFGEQYEVWGTLGLAYHPSVIYKIKMVVFQDQAPQEVPLITEKSINIL